MKTKLMRISSVFLAVLLLLSTLAVLPTFAQSGTQDEPATVQSTASAVTTGTDSTGAYKRLEALLERGGVESTYNLGYNTTQYKSYMRSAYDIKTGGATRLALESIGVSHTTVWVQFFTADYAKISAAPYTDGAVISIPGNCDFIRIEITTTAEPESVAIRFYGATGTPREAKRNGFNSVSERLTYKVSDEIAEKYGVADDKIEAGLYTTSRLKLPTNYSTDGQKAPVILWLEGSGGSFTSWSGDFDTGHREAIRYLADEGFAVYTIYTWGNIYAQKYPNCGKALPYPTPTNLACLEAGIEYICDRYNLDRDNIHVMSKSQGGQVSLYYATVNALNVKSIGMFAPVLDYLSMPGEALYADTRAAIAEDMGFVGDVDYFASPSFCAYDDRAREFFRQNLDKLAIMNEAWTGLTGATLEELFEEALDDCETFWTDKIWNTNRTDIYTNTHYVKTASVPVKIWGAPNDAATPYLKMVEVVQQLKNGGCEAEMRTFASGGHGCADYNNTTSGVVTASGTVYNSLGIGWVENVAWIRAHMTAQDDEICNTEGHDYGEWTPNNDHKTHFKVCANNITHRVVDRCAYTSVVTQPTCTSGGSTTYTCSVCGDVYTDAVKPALGHKDEDGDLFCDVCEEYFELPLTGAAVQTSAHVAKITYGARSYYYTSFDTAVVEALENRLPEVVVLKNTSASKLTDETVKYVDDGEVLTVTAVSKSVTLTVYYKGFQVYDGSLTFKDMKLVLDNMSYDSIVYYAGATLTFDGVDIECTANICAIERSGGTSGGETITFIDCSITVPTPSATAYLVYVGGKKANIFVTNTTTNAAIAKSASGGAIDMTVNNVALTNGAAYVLPNGSTNVTVVDLGICQHNYGAVVTPPTCTERGYTTYTCSKCDDSYTVVGAAASGHAYGSWVANGDKTHTKTCANDASHKVTESCTYTSAVTAPTCTEAGYTTYTCTGCGDVYVEAGAAASGHAYGNWVANGDKTHTKTCPNEA